MALCAQDVLRGAVRPQDGLPLDAGATPGGTLFCGKAAQRSEGTDLNHLDRRQSAIGLQTRGMVPQVIGHERADEVVAMVVAVVTS